MSEIQDLKNHILALDAKINNLLLIIQGFNRSNDNINEVVNMIHSLGLERSNQNNVIFETIYPDLIRRINKIENAEREKLEKEREEERQNRAVNQILSMPVEKLDFKYKRTLHCMQAEGIKDVASILKHCESDFLKVPNFGKKSLRDLNETLSKYNLKLKSYDELRGS